MAADTQSKLWLEMEDAVARRVALLAAVGGQVGASVHRRFVGFRVR